MEEDDRIVAGLSEAVPANIAEGAAECLGQLPFTHGCGSSRFAVPGQEIHPASGHAAAGRERLAAAADAFLAADPGPPVRVATSRARLTSDSLWPSSPVVGQHGGEPLPSRLRRRSGRRIADLRRAHRRAATLAVRLSRPGTGDCRWLSAARRFGGSPRTSKPSGPEADGTVAGLPGRRLSTTRQHHRARPTTARAPARHVPCPRRCGPPGQAGQAWGSNAMFAGLAFSRWWLKLPSLRPKTALPKSAWLSLSRKPAG